MSDAEVHAVTRQATCFLWSWAERQIDLPFEGGALRQESLGGLAEAAKDVARRLRDDWLALSLWRGVVGVVEHLLDHIARLQRDISHPSPPPAEEGPASLEAGGELLAELERARMANASLSRRLRLSEARRREAEEALRRARREWEELSSRVEPRHILLSTV